MAKWSTASILHSRTTQRSAPAAAVSGRALLVRGRVLGCISHECDRQVVAVPQPQEVEREPDNLR
jgi:hypothetical protein